MNGPTWLTLVRMVMAGVFMGLVMVPASWARIAALVVFTLAAVTDKVDGIWARKSKQVTDLGAFLDPLADKMLVNLAFLALTVLGVVPVWVFSIILVRDFAVDGMRMMVARNGITVAASFYGKLKTTVQMVALIILLLNLIVNNSVIGTIGNIALDLALGLTIFSGIDYISQGLREL